MTDLKITYVEFDSDIKPSSACGPISSLAYVEWKIGHDEFHAPGDIKTDEDGELIGDDTGARAEIPEEVRAELARIIWPKAGATGALLAALKTLLKAHDDHSRNNPPNAWEGGNPGDLFPTAANAARIAIAEAEGRAPARVEG